MSCSLVMKMQIEFLTVARQEIGNTADQYNAVRPGLGRAIIIEVDNKLTSVKQHPKLYQLQFTNLYRFSLDCVPCQLYYGLSFEKIIVLGCVPSRMEPKLKHVAMSQRLNQWKRVGKQNQ